MPGYIISKAGDTLTGKIEILPDVFKAQKVALTDTASQIRTVYYPGDIDVFYRSDGYYFVSKKFWYYSPIPEIALYKVVNTNSENPARKAYKEIPATAFMRVIVRGYASLYTCKVPGDDKKSYFIEVPGHEIKQLINDKRYVPAGEMKFHYKYRNTINDTIQMLFADCRDMKKIEKLKRVIEQDLVNLVTSYNDCIKSDYEIFQLRSKEKVKFGVNEGMQFTNLLARGVKDAIIEQYNFKSKPGLSAGATFEWFPDPAKEKWALGILFT